MKNAIKKFATISMAFTLLGTGAAFFGNNTLTASAATTTSSQWVSSTIEIVRTYKNGKLVSTKTINFIFTTALLCGEKIYLQFNCSFAVRIF